MNRNNHMNFSYSEWKIESKKAYAPKLEFRLLEIVMHVTSVFFDRIVSYLFCMNTLMLIKSMHDDHMPLSALTISLHIYLLHLPAVFGDAGY